MAALRLTQPELAAIQTDAGLTGDKAVLSLENVTQLHRYAALARSLRLAAADFIALKQLSSIDPFAGPDKTLEFVALANRVRQSGFSIGQLNYLYRNLDDPAASFTTRPGQDRRTFADPERGPAQDRRRKQSGP